MLSGLFEPLQRPCFPFCNLSKTLMKVAGVTYEVKLKIVFITLHISLCLKCKV